MHESTPAMTDRLSRAGGWAICLVGCLIVAACTGTDRPEISDIAADEHVQFFRTAAWMDDDGQYWNVPIHGWIYEPEDSAVRKAAFEVILESEFDLAVADQYRANFERRLNLLIADNERGKQVVVDIGGEPYALSPSSENGHFMSTIRVPVGDAVASDGELRYSAVTRDGGWLRL